ncbi:Hypothetical protein SCF082_LOCUS39145 [Durusdinium trenchii]
MAIVEVVMKRFALLPVLFPGVFAIREKRLYFFDIEVKEVTIGKALRWEAMMIMRVTLAVVLSYLWEFCVFQSTTHVGRDFPSEECDSGMDCFSTQLEIQTFISRNHQPVNCSAVDRHGFDEQVVVSCVRFVTPSLSAWLMHLAIAHSMTQLNLKSFGLLVWLCGHSVWFHRAVLATAITSLVIVCGLTFGGVMTRFNSSWSGFVISFSFPLFFWIVWNCGNILKTLWAQESRQMQESIEEKLALALQDLARRSGEDSQLELDPQPDRVTMKKRSIFSLQGAGMGIFKMTSLLRSSHNSNDRYEEKPKSSRDEEEPEADPESPPSEVVPSLSRGLQHL